MKKKTKWHINAKTQLLSMLSHPLSRGTVLLRGANVFIAGNINDYELLKKKEAQMEVLVIIIY